MVGLLNFPPVGVGIESVIPDHDLALVGNVGSHPADELMVFFSGTGGMIGVASQAGRAWAVPTIVLFLMMTALSFVQRAVTGI